MTSEQNLRFIVVVIFVVSSSMLVLYPRHSATSVPICLHYQNVPDAQSRWRAATQTWIYNRAFWEPLPLENNITLFDEMVADSEAQTDPRYYVCWLMSSATVDVESKLHNHLFSDIKQPKVKRAVLERGIARFREPQEGNNGAKHFGGLVPPRTRDKMRWCVEHLQEQLSAVLQKVNNRDALPPMSLLRASQVGYPPITPYNDTQLHVMYLEAYVRLFQAMDLGLDFSGIEHYVEIGAGIGQQAEMMAQFFPEMSIYTFDLPTQTYIADRFLSRTFPDRFIPYHQSNALPKISSSRPGTIMTLVNYRIADLEVDGSKTIFFNTASFEEMPLDIALSYLDVIVAKRIKYLFLWEWTKRPDNQPDLGNFEDYDNHLQHKHHYVKLGQKTVDFYHCKHKDDNGFQYAVWRRP